MDCNKYYFVDQAKQDLNDILLYLSDVLLNKKAAGDFYTALVNKLNLLCSFPDIGQDVNNSGLIEKYVKKINVKSYYLYYHYDLINQTIWVLRIIHYKRDINSIIKKGSSRS